MASEPSDEMINTNFPFMEFPLSLSRQGAFPLDRRTLFSSLQNAFDYARSDATAYVGQLLSVVTVSTSANNVRTYNTKVYVIKSTTGGTVEDILAELSFKSEVDDISKKFTGILNSGIQFQGIINSKNPLPQSAYQKGYIYEISEDGTYAGKTCYAGDLILCIEDPSGDSSYNDKWEVISSSSDGTVLTLLNGSYAENAEGTIPVFEGTSGRLLNSSHILATNIVDVTNYLILDGGNSYNVSEPPSVVITDPEVPM